jgi:mutual gliding-motility protein MglA
VAHVDFEARTVEIKLTYWGAALSGRTSHIGYMRKQTLDAAQPELTLLKSDDRDQRIYKYRFNPPLPPIKGFAVQLWLYAACGNEVTEEAQDLVLKGTDGVVFIADSQRIRQGANLEALERLEMFLDRNGSLESTRHLFAFNKRDLPDIATVEELNASLNRHAAPVVESVASTGVGVVDALKGIFKGVLSDVMR